MKTLGEKIKEARDVKGWTLDQLAKKSSVSKAFLSQLENGKSDKPSAEVLYKIATSLGVSIANLLGKSLEKTEAVDNFPPNLEKAAVENNWSMEDKKLLAGVAFRSNGEDLSPDDWNYLYDTIQRTIKKN